MDFFEQVDAAQALVARHGRVSRRGLVRQFGGDDELVAEIGDELAVRGVARWDGDELVGTPDAAPEGSDASDTSPVSVDDSEDTSDEASIEMPPGGQIRHLTVMFCDVMGSTELSGQINTEAWAGAMRRFHALAATAVENWDGHVGNYLGDGIVAYFGYPIALEDAGSRAVRAGLNMVDALPELNNELRSSVGRDLQIRIGIHTGPVLVDEFGGVVQAMGQTANIAARVEAAAPPDSVAMSATTRRLTSGIFVTEDLGEHHLKGVAEPMTLTRALRVGGVAPRAGGRVMGSKMVGRQIERALLADRWARALSGEGQVVTVVGEAGIGKSRLIDEFREDLSAESHSWLDASCSPYDQSAPLSPIADLVRRGLRIERDSTEDERLAALVLACDAVGIDAERGPQLLGPLVAIDDLTAEETDTSAFDRVELLDLLVEWVTALARLQPLVLFLDDIHWADPTTLDLLDRLIDRAVTEPLLLVATARPDNAPKIAARNHHTPIHLTRLSKRQTVEVARGAAPTELGDDMIDAIVERADGIPLFTEELAATIVADADGEYSVPDSLENLLLSRLDRLAGLRELAQCASVIGREFARSELDHVVDLATEDLELLLERMVVEEFFFRRGAAPDCDYVFRHALMRDAVYETMLTPTRQQFHRRFADGLLAVEPDRAKRRPDLVAEHLTAAGAADEASRWWQTAGERASARAAAKEAASFYQRAIDHADRSDPHRLVTLRLALAGSLSSIHGYGAPVLGPVFDELVDLAAASGLDWQLSVARLGRAGGMVARGEFENARSESMLGGDVAITAGIPDLVNAHRAIDVLIWNFEGHPLKAIALAEEIARMGYVSTDRVDRSMGLASDSQIKMFHAYSLAQIGEFSQARQIADTIKVNTGPVGPASTTQAITMRSTISLLEGDMVRYGEISEEFLASAERYDLDYFMAIGSITTAVARAIIDPDAEKLAAIHDAVENLETTGNLLAAPIFLWSLAQAELACGRPDRAVDSLTLGQALADGTHQQWYRGQIAASLAKAHLLTDTPSSETWLDLEAATLFTTERTLRVGRLHVAMARVELGAAVAPRATDLAELRNALDDMPERGTSPTITKAEALLET